MDEFIGRGWAFPVARPGGDSGSGSGGGSGGGGGSSNGGDVALAVGERTVQDSIWMILSTAPGERVMRPDFGCRIRDFVFDVNDASTAGAVSAAVDDALATWEPRIDVLDVTTTAAPDDPYLLLVEINYRVRSSNSRVNLVYPYYLG